MTRAALPRNIAAESRAVEEGHRAFVEDDGSIRVVSDTRDGKHYLVTYVAVGGLVRFTCDPRGTAAFSDDHLHVTADAGVVPCKHAAVAARRLERSNLIRLAGTGDPYEPGTWILTDGAVAEQLAKFDLPDDPFEGLPG